MLCRAISHERPLLPSDLMSCIAMVGSGELGLHSDVQCWAWRMESERPVRRVPLRRPEGVMQGCCRWAGGVGIGYKYAPKRYVVTRNCGARRVPSWPRTLYGKLGETTANRPTPSHMPLEDAFRFGSPSQLRCRLSSSSKVTFAGLKEAPHGSSEPRVLMLFATVRKRFVGRAHSEA